MIKDPMSKYIPFVPLKMERRTWPDKEITQPPIWCSVTCGTATRPWWTP